LAALPALRALSITWQTNFGDADAAALGRFASVEELDLSGTSITDGCLAHIAAMPRLKKLNVSHTQVSSAGLAGPAYRPAWKSRGRKNLPDERKRQRSAAKKNLGILGQLERLLSHISCNGRSQQQPRADRRPRRLGDVRLRHRRCPRPHANDGAAPVNDLRHNTCVNRTLQWNPGGRTSYAWHGHKAAKRRTRRRMPHVMTTTERLVACACIVIAGCGAPNAFDITTISSGATVYALYDGLGSIDRITGSTGSVTKQGAYEAYGQVLVSPGYPQGWIAQPGYYYDSDSGLYYVRQRWYDPNTKQWVSPDPKRSALQISLFAYSLNSPVAFFDPSGKDSAAITVPGVNSGIPRVVTQSLLVNFQYTINCGAGSAKVSDIIPPGVLLQFPPTVDVTEAGKRIGAESSQTTDEYTNIGLSIQTTTYVMYRQDSCPSGCGIPIFFISARQILGATNTPITQYYKLVANPNPAERNPVNVFDKTETGPAVKVTWQGKTQSSTTLPSSCTCIKRPAGLGSDTAFPVDNFTSVIPSDTSPTTRPTTSPSK